MTQTCVAAKTSSTNTREVANSCPIRLMAKRCSVLSVRETRPNQLVVEPMKPTKRARQTRPPRCVEAARMPLMACALLRTWSIPSASLLTRRTRPRSPEVSMRSGACSATSVRIFSTSPSGHNASPRKSFRAGTCHTSRSPRSGARLATSRARLPRSRSRGQWPPRTPIRSSRTRRYSLRSGASTKPRSRSASSTFTSATPRHEPPPFGILSVVDSRDAPLKQSRYLIPESLVLGVIRCTPRAGRRSAYGV